MSLFKTKSKYKADIEDSVVSFISSWNISNLHMNVSYCYKWMICRHLLKCQIKWFGFWHMHVKEYDISLNYKQDTWGIGWILNIELTTFKLKKQYLCVCRLFLWLSDNCMWLLMCLLLLWETLRLDLQSVFEKRLHIKPKKYICTYIEYKSTPICLLTKQFNLSYYCIPKRFNWLQNKLHQVKKKEYHTNDIHIQNKIYLRSHPI